MNSFLEAVFYCHETDTLEVRTFFRRDWLWREIKICGGFHNNGLNWWFVGYL